MKGNKQKIERFLKYYESITNQLYESKEMAKIYLSNLEALAMEIDGCEEYVKQARQFVANLT